mmetsp:Transcript_25865/g.25135  ORF Transcript_25865/g.25135 Transcript_25865/m.25135 type:complete len:138 (+) Transcript_25865:1080-1493(+)
MQSVQSSFKDKKDEYSRNFFSNRNKASSVFSTCKEELMISRKELSLINLKETEMKKDFDVMKDKASHIIVLGNDDIKHSVEDFHDQKHIFIYNKDLSKGYFLKIDPHRVSEIARRLHTFKFKEPRIVCEDERLSEEQ